MNWSTVVLCLSGAFLLQILHTTVVIWYDVLLTAVQISGTKNERKVQQDRAEEVIYEQKQPTAAVNCQTG